MKSIMIENTVEGRAEIKIIRKLFKGSKYQVIVKGRHANRRAAFEAIGLTYRPLSKTDVPIKIAQRYAVYIKNKKTGEHLDNENMVFEREQKYKLERENYELRTTICDLERKIQSYVNLIGEIKTLIN